MIIKFTALLCIFYILHHSMSETPFKRSCLDLHRPSTYVSGVCIVLHEGNALNRADANIKCNTQYNGHLATVYNQPQMDKIAAILDLSMPAWCDLKRDPNNTNSWLHTPSADDGPKPKSNIPPWDTSIPNNPSLVGDGVVLGENGMKNEDETAIHPFLCQYAEPPSAPTRYDKRSKGYRASNQDALNQWTVENIFICTDNCDRVSECQSLAYSKSSKECHLYSLPSEALSQISDTDLELFDKIMKDSDCTSPTECFPEASHFLLIGGTGAPNMESYYPQQPSKNGIVATLSANLEFCMAEWYDGKIMILGGYHIFSTWFLDPDTHLVTPAPDMPGPALRKSASATLHGAVVVCAGWEPVNHDTAACIKFENYQWSSMPPLNQKRHASSIVNFKNKLYVIGGWVSGTGMSNSIECFDPELDTWTPINGMPIAGDVVGLEVFKEAIFMCGGDFIYRPCYKYNEASDEWIPIGSMNQGRVDNHLLLFNNKLYAVSGKDSSGNEIKGLEIYDAISDTWSNVSTQRIESRMYFATVVV